MATKPMFSTDQDMTNVTPEDVAEAKRRAKAEETYNKLSTIAPSPKPAASAAKPAASAASAASSPKKMAKGGSASARADGIAQRGKTRGTMVMCGGGMARGR